MSKRPTSSPGFSLVEVTFALAVISFCLMTLLALLPTGIALTQNALRGTIAADLASSVASDLGNTSGTNTSTTASQSPQFNLTVPQPGSGVSAVQTLYFNQNGSLTGPVG